MENLKKAAELLEEAATLLIKAAEKLKEGRGWPKLGVSDRPIIAQTCERLLSREARRLQRLLSREANKEKSKK